MDGSSVLAHILKPRGMSTLLGGELPALVINSSKYIAQLASEAQIRDINVKNELPSLDHAIHAALSGETRNVILEGSEGSGKSTTLEKIIMDWAKGEHLQHFSCVFYYRFRELNSLDENLSLETLMLHHHGHIPPESVPLVLQKPEEVLFVFDDLDQSILNLSDDNLCSDPSQATSLACLVKSLLHGSLLKGASFLVSTRSRKDLSFLSGTKVEVLGFLKPQREAYFNKFFPDPVVASKASMHMERTLGFYDICTSPRFCWAVCCVYKSLMDAGTKLPETLTQIYVEILLHLLQMLSLNKSCSKDLVLTLGKLASHLSIDQHSNCSKEEIDSLGFQDFPTSVGFFLRVDGDQSGRCMYSFHSQLVQEFLLAVSFFLVEVVSEGVEKRLEKHKPQARFLDVFLSALSEPVQRRPLETLLGEFNSDQIVEFKRWFAISSERALKGWHREEHYHCLHMLHQAQNVSLVKEVITDLASLSLSYGSMRLEDCVALNYVVTCLGGMNTLNLCDAKNLTEEKAEALVSAMSLPQMINLSDGSVTLGAVHHLAAALSKGVTKELDLTRNQLGDEKFKILCAGLRDCKLQNLKLFGCNLTEASCEDLVSVLTSNTSHLSVLNMAFNEIGDQGFTKLCKALHSPQCKLLELDLQRCNLTAASMENLSASLCFGRSELRKVNLSGNNIGCRGMEALCIALQQPHNKLQSLNVFCNELTGECCPRLMEALMSEHCSLSDLDLSLNEFGQEGALLLCQAFSRPGCQITKLCLTGCELTEPVFKELGSVLRSGTSRLTSLSVGLNKVGDQGLRHLWDAVAHPNCLLEELDVEMTSMTDASVEHLCSALRASKSLKSLELRNNLMTDASVPALVQVMQDSENMLEMNVKYNDFTEDMFEIMGDCDKIIY